ncbi:MAG: 50S ribosomal protein L25 [Deltaproteobacteria bacterium]|nr:50S ribosomal protein L25 [Deltaproteobacteria bacterium]
MEQLDIAAWPREVLGKEVTGRMRKEGFVPAVLYGSGIKENLHLKLVTKDVNKALHTHSGTNVLLNLSIEGEKITRTVMFKSLDWHPAKDTLVHIDLVGIDVKNAVTIEVPLHITGKCVGVSLGGMLQQEARELKIECLPDNIPDSIEVDVTTLGLGDSLHIKDLKLPEGVTVLDDEGLTVVLVAAPKEEEVEKTPEEAEAELAASLEDKSEKDSEDTSEEKK